MMASEGTIYAAREIAQVVGRDLSLLAVARARRCPAIIRRRPPASANLDRSPRASNLPMFAVSG
jgi:hypothetical protein